MNLTLQSYTALSETLLLLCKASNKEEFASGTDELVKLLQKVSLYNLFPLDLNLEYVSGIIPTDLHWEEERNELCRQLYIGLATLMYSFEASNIFNRAYFDYILEYARTSLPYNVANDWGKEFILDKHFSHQGFFFAINRDQRFLHKTEEEYKEYAHTIQEMEAPIRPSEKIIPIDILNDLQKRYNTYYNYYCDSIECLYPEIKEMFKRYNKHIRVYLCSSDVLKDNSTISYVIVNYYPSIARKISVYPYYVDLAYRFCNIEEFEEELAFSSLSAFKSGSQVYNFIDKASIFHEANSQFIAHASIPVLQDYVSYFLRGRGERVLVLEDGSLSCNDKKIVFCENDESVEDIGRRIASEPSIHYMFVHYPPTHIVELLKSKNIPWDVVPCYGQDMINNDNAKMVHWFIKDNIDVLKNVHVDNYGQFLEQRIGECRSGRYYWHDYELIGQDVFSYLFKDDFVNYLFKTQSSTEDGVQRRDMVISNNYRDQSSFWGRMNQQYQCKLIIVDFKNYSDPIDSDCIYSTTKYMSENVGKFVLVFSRHGVDKSGQKEQVRLCQDGKLVLCLSDENLLEMVQLKQSGKNPLSVIEQLFFTLLQSV